MLHNTNTKLNEQGILSLCRHAHTDTHTHTHLHTHSNTRTHTLLAQEIAGGKYVNTVPPKQEEGIW